MNVLEVKNFAQIESAKIDFGDLTVLVGPQASGKSLLLQWFKVAIDLGELLYVLKEAGDDISTPKNQLDLIFGEGMSAAWNDQSTEVRFNQRPIGPSARTRLGKKKQDGRVFYIPAHRALLLSDGWPAPFLKLNADTPVVARLFSQNLHQRFSGRQAASLFSVERILKDQYRRLIDEAVFHGGRVELEKVGLRYRLRLAFSGETQLPFMTWTAGQREFTPLLLGLYHVLTPRHTKKHPDIEWVIIEEPEMGLHPDAIAVVMLLVLDLLWRGYKVVISTHSPLILDVVWTMRHLTRSRHGERLLCQAFRTKSSPAVRAVMNNALRSEYRVHFLDVDQATGRVTSRDISKLDPGASNRSEAEWGGLTGFSSRFSNAVRTAANEVEAEAIGFEDEDTAGASDPSDTTAEHAPTTCKEGPGGPQV